jgi:hypothetical protein
MLMLGVIIFGSALFSLEKINQTKNIIFLNLKLKPVQIDWFRFGLVFVVQKPVKLRIKSRFCSSRTCSSLQPKSQITT